MYLHIHQLSSLELSYLQNRLDHSRGWELKQKAARGTFKAQNFLADSEIRMKVDPDVFGACNSEHQIAIHQSS